MNESVHVRAAICYGRRSKKRGETYTMTFDPRKRAGGRAVLVPCVVPMNTLDDLIGEARALWAAERETDELDGTWAEWGCVGVAFHGTGTAVLAERWKNSFQDDGTEAVWPVKENGVLGIRWPRGAGRLGLDVILATATRPRGEQSIEAVAGAWIEQDEGREEYFFRNVASRIRTPDDLAIWRRMEQGRCRWRAVEKYPKAVRSLRREAA